jgi:putative membrane protein
MSPTLPEESEFMLTKPTRSLFRPLGRLWRPLVPIVIYIGLVSVVDLTYHLEKYNLPIQLVTITGTVIGLLLAFRTNSAYCRWWEARTIWGAIVNDSRTWVRQLMVFVESGNSPKTVTAHVREMNHRQIAWCYSLCRSLRRQDPLLDATDLLSEGERKELEQHVNVPNAILLKQGHEISRLFRQGQLQEYQFVELERTLKRLTDSMGGCERIKNTPFPTSYGVLVRCLSYLFIALLPFGLANMPEVGLIITSLSLAMAFLVIDAVAVYLQDPFENRPSDTPMLTLSRTIEINIRQMLGETDLPDPIEPVDGIQY